MLRLCFVALPLLASLPAHAQTTATPAAPGTQIQSVPTGPAVDNGVGNGVMKQPGSPSVGDGVGNGVVKQQGAPSVGSGIANGSVKSGTEQQ